MLIIARALSCVVDAGGGCPLCSASRGLARAKRPCKTPLLSFSSSLSTSPTLTPSRSLHVSALAADAVVEMGFHFNGQSWKPPEVCLFASGSGTSLCSFGGSFGAFHLPQASSSDSASSSFGACDHLSFELHAVLCDHFEDQDVFQWSVSCQ